MEKSTNSIQNSPNVELKNDGLFPHAVSLPLMPLLWSLFVKNFFEVNPFILGHDTVTCYDSIMYQMYSIKATFEIQSNSTLYFLSQNK